MKLFASIILILIINSYSGFSEWELIDYLKTPTKDAIVLINNETITQFYKDKNNFLHIKEINKPDIQSTKSILWNIQNVIEYDNNYIVCSVTDIFFFNKKSIELTNEFKLKSLAFNAKQIDSILYFYASNVSLCKYNANSIVNKYNPYTNMDFQIKFDQFPNDVQMTLFGPRKLIAISNNEIVISDVTKYSFNIFDLNGNFLNNIQRSDNSWIPIEGELTENYCTPNLMSILMKDEHFIDECSQIWLCNFLNDTTLLITWETPVKKNEKEVTYNFYHDVWVKKENNWDYEETISELSNNEPKILNGNSIQLKWDYKFSNGYLYIIKPYPLELVKKYFGKSFKEFENEMNEFYIDNELQYTCFIYKYVP